MSQITSADLSKSAKTSIIEKSDQIEVPKVRLSITVRRQRDEIYNFWRDFGNFARFMEDIDSVEEIDSKTSKWKVRLKSGETSEWTARIVADEPGRKISWSSLNGSGVQTDGTVEFETAPSDLGTVIHMAMDYSLPGGKLVEWATMFKGEDPNTLAKINLKRIKAQLETGEVATTEGQSSGREESPKLKH